MTPLTTDHRIDLLGKMGVDVSDVRAVVERARKFGRPVKVRMELRELMSYARRMHKANVEELGDYYTLADKNYVLRMLRVSSEDPLIFWVSTKALLDQCRTKIHGDG
jgi:hypothetical protein